MGRLMRENGADLKLMTCAPERVAALMTWFPDRRSCLIWGGPRFRFPFTAQTFAEDTRAHSLPSYILVNAADDLLGFGQYYLRAGRCHFARLAIAPGQRGKGLGSLLVSKLAEIGAPDLGTSECSLFVLQDNLPAVRLYEKLGFVRSAYPEQMDSDLERVDYMIVGSRRLQSSCH